MGLNERQCQVDGCTRKVARAGHALCLEHWKERQGFGKAAAREEEEDVAESRGLLSSTKIAKHFGVSNVRVNLILAELGWIEKCGEGWSPTERGNALGANVKEKKKPFVLWPGEILKNAALVASVAEQTGKVVSSVTREARGDDFRKKFPADYQTADGHWVRSRAEAMIDNWLYMQGIVHAYERRLPIEEDCYCDFYIPNSGKGIYVEYWGREWDAKYRARKAEKQGIYLKYKLPLIELGDAEIERLDDVMPKMLLRFEIQIM